MTWSSLPPPPRRHTRTQVHDISLKLARRGGAKKEEFVFIFFYPHGSKCGACACVRKWKKKRNDMRTVFQIVSEVSTFYFKYKQMSYVLWFCKILFLPWYDLSFVFKILFAFEIFLVYFNIFSQVNLINIPSLKMYTYKSIWNTKSM